MADVLMRSLQSRDIEVVHRRLRVVMLQAYRPLVAAQAGTSLSPQSWMHLQRRPSSASGALALLPSLH